MFCGLVSLMRKVHVQHLFSRFKQELCDGDSSFLGSPVVFHPSPRIAHVELAYVTGFQVFEKPLFIVQPRIVLHPLRDLVVDGCESVGNEGTQETQELIQV